MANFTVDTHLFRELGELLVGRDSTALIELIKNSYDADATEVVVLGQNLSDPEEGLIVITDNGTGMTRSQFERGFLRVASRIKDSGDRKSALHKRRYTGAKGIGRLAAHKLARLLEVRSIPWLDSELEGSGPRLAVEARIDWDAIERFETLDEIDGSDAVMVDTGDVESSAAHGTVLCLSRLRRSWTPTQRARFFAEVQSFAPPEFLTKRLRASVVEKSLLFEKPLVRLAESNGQEFAVRLEGEFSAGDDYWRLIENHAAWVIEIHCRPGDPKVHYSVAPTNKTLKDLPDAKPYTVERDHPSPDQGPHFDARIFLRVGRYNKIRGDQRTWASRSSGVRVYMEGFRVLPYGEPQNDWLELDADYTKRARSIDRLKDWEIEGLEHQDDRDVGLSGFPSNNYFGGVFLIQEHAESMRMLVNREGFVPEGGYDHLVELVRAGLDFATRVHASASYPVRKARRESRQQNRPEVTSRSQAKGITPNSVSLRTSLEDATEVLAMTRAHLVTATRGAETDALAEKLSETISNLSVEAAYTSERISEQSLLRVLASIGTQMAAFVHEIRSLLGASQAVEQAIQGLRDTGLSRDQKKTLATVHQAVGDLRRSLEREASYLTDIANPDARRRRSRQKLFERLSVASRLLANTAERRSVRIENRISPGLKSPPIFPAELTAIFTNLLSNAIKAAGRDGRIHVSASSENDGTVHIVMQNTGVAVDLEDAENWFRPFESTTSEVDPVLGQGMGLGLPITRRMLEEYGAEVRFVQPLETAFATAIQVTFPGES